MLIKMVLQIKPIRSKRLSEWFSKHLTPTVETLSQVKGSFTDVMSAKVIEIFRKRGCLEELELNQTNYRLLINCCSRLPGYVEEVTPQEEIGIRCNTTTIGITTSSDYIISSIV